MSIAANRRAAAAIAARSRVSPRDIDIKVLQKELLRQDVYLGDDGRLRELGLE